MKKWSTIEVDDVLVSKLVEAIDIPRPIATTLVSRGFSDEELVDLYLNPRLSKVFDPFDLPNMKAAVTRVWQALEAGERITVYGDYDVDGITSTALLVTILRKLGGEVSYFLPHRVDDGYGLTNEAVQKCLDESQPKLIITVDCGTGSVESVEYARERGVDVVVTDHHECTGEPAKAVAVVNPKLGDDENMRILAGVGVAFKLCHALIKQGRENGQKPSEQPDLKEHLDWVALGTVCDMVPLKGENRILVRYGLQQFKETSSIGLRELMLVSSMERDADVDTYHLGFLLGPRLNASGRLGDATAALELLLTEDKIQAREIAEDLDTENTRRKKMEADTVETASKEIDEYFDEKKHFGLIVSGEGWHPGVVGIVASRLVKKYNRPTIVIAVDDKGMGKGSCRSIKLFNLVEGLGQCADVLTRWGGHHMAAGLSIPAAEIDAFRFSFNEVCREVLEGEDLRPEQRVDAWVDLSDADRALFDAQEKMGPFGMENPRPVWAVKSAHVVGEPRILKEKHLRMNITAGNSQLGGIGFGLAEQVDLTENPIDVAFRLQLNSWKGRETLEMQVQDIRSAEADRG